MVKFTEARASATPDAAMQQDKDEFKGDARDDRLRGPMKALQKEKEFVRKQMLKDARDKCDETRAAYIECAKGMPRTQKKNLRLASRC